LKDPSPGGNRAKGLLVARASLYQAAEWLTLSSSHRHGGGRLKLKRGRALTRPSVAGCLAPTSKSLAQMNNSPKGGRGLSKKYTLDEGTP